jgi:hypothetical protein
MPEAMIIGDIVPLPLSTQLTSDYASKDARTFIKPQEGESTNLYEERVAIAQAIIDAPYDVIEGLENSYFSDNVVMQLTNLIVGVLHYGARWPSRIHELLELIMDVAGL